MHNLFSQPTADWFRDSFAGPTLVQKLGWPAIATTGHTLLLAPTGSGKTLAAFLVGIDRTLALPSDADPGVRVLYVSPLKALVYDVERNLRSPLRQIIERAGAEARQVTVDVRTGDTPQRDRRRQLRRPADILVTTPESLYLMLTSAARETLRTVHTVIIDEIHALVPTKRGVHLSLSLERLQALCERAPQRIGLSATVRPVRGVADFLVGVGRPVQIIDAADEPQMDLVIEVPVEDMTQPVVQGPDGPRKAASLWPAIYPRLLELIRQHRTTLVFTNSRLLCERLCQKLNELADEEVAMAHHGSVSHARRGVVEEALKGGQIPCIVATSSLELGIDMGAIDLVVMVESPGSSARGLQRIGRAGHQVGATSVGRMFPKFQGDLLEAAVVGQRMCRGLLEPLSAPANCLDVLCQQLVAMITMKDRSVVELFDAVRQAWPYRALTMDALVACLDMLSGRYPTDDFADLRPRVVWDRSAGVLSPRKGSRMLAVLNAGTIPDRGLYTVFQGAGGPRIGELDEEMVFETRRGDTIILGASTWRVDEITRDRVLVSPAPGEHGRMPFWRGEGPGRPVELGRSLGAFLRELCEQPASSREAWLRQVSPLDGKAARNLLRYIDEQRTVTGTLPTDRAITVECFRDEIGDWRVVVLTPFGARVHAPWALAIQQTLSLDRGFDVQCMHSDDGVVLRFADTEELPDLDALVPDPEQVEELVVQQLRSSALFAARFREAAGRALLLPRHRPGKRTPLWAQRRKGESLLAVASRFPSFPIVLEAYRECLQDVFDVPALIEVLNGLRSRAIRLDVVESAEPSPFARSLVFAWVANFLYDTDAPLAERRAQALTLDRTLLRQLLGRRALREILDAEAVQAVRMSLQHLHPHGLSLDVDQLHDQLRRLGDLSQDELQLRSESPDSVASWLAQLGDQGRAVQIVVAGVERWICAHDAGRYRDALGVTLPDGFVVDTVADDQPLRGLLVRWARTHGPFVVAEPAARWGLPTGVVASVCASLVAESVLVRGELSPGGTQVELCHADVLRRLRRASLQKLRGEIAPVDAAAVARFLPRWQGLVGRRREGLQALRDVIASVEGLALPFSTLHGVVLPERVSGFQADHLDQLGAMGEVVWVGRGAIGSRDGRVALYRRERAGLLLPPEGERPDGPLHELILHHLQTRGASFMAQLLGLSSDHTRVDIVAAIWDLVWAGFITNDTFQPLRGLGSRAPRSGRRSRVMRSAGGRWDLVARLRTEVSETERLHAVSQSLLDRYGVVGREAALFEQVPGGFTRVYRVLRAMEEAGKIRRGHFVQGFGGAQFALPGAVDRLRDKAIDETLVLAACDPAQPWGSLLSWPVAAVQGARPRRVPGALVVLHRGALILFVDRGMKTAWSFGGVEPSVLVLAARSLGERRGLSGVRSPRVQRLDGVDARLAPSASAFVEAGWVADDRGLNWAI